MVKARAATDPFFPFLLICLAFALFYVDKYATITILHFLSIRRLMALRFELTFCVQFKKMSSIRRLLTLVSNE